MITVMVEVVPLYIGRGRPRTYTPDIVTTRPLRKLVFVACGNMWGE